MGPLEAGLSLFYCEPSMLLLSPHTWHTGRRASTAIRSTAKLPSKESVTTVRQHAVAEGVDSSEEYEPEAQCKSPTSPAAKKGEGHGDRTVSSTIGAYPL